MFISCSWISLYTSTILISAKPATQKMDLDQIDPPIVLAGLLSWDRMTRTFVLNYSDAVGVADTLIQRGATGRGGGGRKRTRVNVGVSAAIALKQRVTMPVAARPSSDFPAESSRKLTTGKQMLARRAWESFRSPRKLFPWKRFPLLSPRPPPPHSSLSLFLLELRSTQKDFTLAWT